MIILQRPVFAAKFVEAADLVRGTFPLCFQSDSKTLYLTPYWKSPTLRANFMSQPPEREIMSGRQFLMLLLGVIALACAPVGQDRAPPLPLDRYIEIELGRLEETYRLLDRFAKEIWPQWDNYHDIEVRIRFPNEVHLLVNPLGPVEPAYERLLGRDVHGKDVYINREKKMPDGLELPLVVGRGRGGLTIRIDLRQLELSGEETERVSFVRNQLEHINDEETAFTIEPTGDSDSYILMLIHEHFHGFQAKHGPRVGSVEGLREFEVTSEYATYSEIEGLALMNAYHQEERLEALEYLKDYHVARELKHELMPPEATEGEPYLALAEGLATYVSLKMAMLVENADYKPQILRENDPLFFGFDYAGSYHENLMNKGMRFGAGWTLDKRGKYYLYGAYQCFLLDRFAPGWKEDFFPRRRSLDELTANLLDMSPVEKKAVASRLVGRYSYEELFAKHALVIKEKAESEKGS